MGNNGCTCELRISHQWSTWKRNILMICNFLAWNNPFPFFLSSLVVTVQLTSSTFESTTTDTFEDIRYEGPQASKWKMANLCRKMKMNHQICQRVNLKIQAIFPGTLQNITQETVQTSSAVNKTLSSWTTISQPLVTSPIPCISSCLLSVTFIHSLLTKPTTNSHLYYTVKVAFSILVLQKLKLHIPSS